MARSEPVQMKTASASGKSKNSKKEIRHLTITPSENGGAVVEHHFKSNDGPYHDSETHSFGPKDHAKLKKHIMSAIGAPADTGATEEAES